jgi:hypothetical protein
MDMESTTSLYWEPVSIYMGLRIELEMDNGGEEKKGE